MTSRERIGRMFKHQEADRIAIFEQAWGPTMSRWQAEGMGDARHVDYFDLDQVVLIYGIDNSPRYPEVTVEETEEFRTYRNNWGTVSRNFKKQTSVPEFIEPGIVTPDDWRRAKARMIKDAGRIRWKFLQENWPQWRERGSWIMPSGWFGFDVTHNFVLGTEPTLIALATDPEWIVDIWQSQLDLQLFLFDEIWNAGYEFDALRWPDDMGYKLSQFFSMDMYRELLKPIHQQAIDWAHAKNIPAYLHSCGDIRPFIPELVEMGLDGLNPLEVKAGVDPLEVKKQYGDRLLLHGGFDALLWNDVDKMEETVRKWVPTLKEQGGFIFATDHTTPSNVSLQDFKRIVDVVKEVGRY